MMRKKNRPERPSPQTEEAAGQGDPTGTLRVIGGTLRGRPIAYSGEVRTRPMKQRVRESAFNLIGGDVRGKAVLDLFAGTGALCWEALSRGAHAALMLERHFPTARLIHQNAVALQMVDRIEVVPGDAFVWGKRLARGEVTFSPDRPWLVFCSPPYDLYVTHELELLTLVQQVMDSAPANSLFVVEADERFEMSKLPPCEWEIRAYLPAVLAIGRNQPEMPNAGGPATDTISSPGAEPS
jgi:16S rRNA (guanine966-N2)-methyltransferase